MEGFKFNFGEESYKNTQIPEKDDITSSDGSYSNLSVVNISERHLKAIGCAATDILRVGPVTIRYLSSADDVEEKLKNSNSAINGALKTHSDLIPGLYEGGLKIWECCLDLINFLAENVDFNPEMKVLELGCGAGIPGILAHMGGASCVVFQDFNAEVLDLVSVPNVLLNSKNQASGCYFVAGDWSIVGPEIAKFSSSFDVILTSETIYNPSSQPKLLQLLKTFLKPNGHVYLAAKSCYFGVGGSVWQFEDLVKRDGKFEINICAVFEAGVKRMVLELTFKKDALPS